MEALKSRNKKFHNALSVIISMIIIFIVTSSHIQENNSIKIAADEIGYWQNAALLTGRDWSGMASVNSYYGFGYGFLLAPIMLFAKSSTDMMHIAVIMQIVMLCSCIIPSRYVIKRLSPNMNVMLQAIISLVSVLYSANVFMVNITIAEILLVTCIWWELFAWIIYWEKGNKLALFFVLAIPLYMYAVHQRTIIHLIIILISVCAILVIRHWINGNRKSVIVKTGVVLVLTIVGFVFVKQYERIYTDSLYAYTDSSRIAVNNVFARTAGILYLFTTPEGLLTILASICGKLFYAFVASYGLVLIGMIAGLERLYLVIVNKSRKTEDILHIFVLINFLAALGVASMAMNGDYATRNDILLYGRYSEYTYGPVILIGVIDVYNKIHNSTICNRKAVCGMIVILVLGIICLYLTVNGSSNSVFWVSCSALGDLRAEIRSASITNKELVLIATVRCILLAAILGLIVCSNIKYKNKLLALWFIIIMTLWVNTANTNWEENVMPWYSTSEYGRKDIAVELAAVDEFGILDVNMGICFQFDLYDAYMHNYNSLDEIQIESEFMYIITDLNSEYADEIREKYEVIKENEKYILWIYR